MYDHNKLRAVKIYHRYLPSTTNGEQWIVILEGENEVVHVNTYNGEVPRGFFSGQFTYAYNSTKVGQKIRKGNLAEWKKPCPFAILVQQSAAVGA